MRNGHPKSVFTSFGKYLAKCFSGKVLKLVYIQEEVGSGSLICTCSTHGSLINLRNKHGSQESHDFFLQFPFADFDEQDFLAIHDFAEIQLIFLTSKYIFENIDGQ
jgi:hypothetical protein